jgi:hypothetical protein
MNAYFNEAIARQREAEIARAAARAAQHDTTPRSTPRAPRRGRIRISWGRRQRPVRLQTPLRTS